jgi:hypothetical protein
MIKANELSLPNSCLNRAEEGEMVFVLLARDVAAPMAIRAWIANRIRLGKNKAEDSQIREAEECARTMEVQRRHCGPFKGQSG